MPTGTSDAWSSYNSPLIFVENRCTTFATDGLFYPAFCVSSQTNNHISWLEYFFQTSGGHYHKVICDTVQLSALSHSTQWWMRKTKPSEWYQRVSPPKSQKNDHYWTLVESGHAEVCLKVLETPWGVSMKNISLCSFCWLTLLKQHYLTLKEEMTCYSSDKLKVQLISNNTHSWSVQYSQAYGGKYWQT